MGMGSPVYQGAHPCPSRSFLDASFALFCLCLLFFCFVLCYRLSAASVCCFPPMTPSSVIFDYGIVIVGGSGRRVVFVCVCVFLMCWTAHPLLVPGQRWECMMCTARVARLPGLALRPTRVVVPIHRNTARMYV